MVLPHGHCMSIVYVKLCQGFFLLGAVYGQVPLGCSPPSAQGPNGYCYFFNTNITINWQNAQIDCGNKGGTLVNLASSTELVSESSLQ